MNAIQYLFRAAICSAIFLSTATYPQMFTRLGPAVFPQDLGFTQGSSWGDVDNDGDMDLLVANGHNDQQMSVNFLYENLKTGMEFRQSFIRLMEDNMGRFGSAAWGDFNRDYHVDLFVPSMDGGPSLFFANEGNGALVQETRPPLTADGIDAVGSTWVDFDNDGQLDLLVVSRENANRLYRNEKPQSVHFFTPVQNAITADDNRAATGASWADVDNDGDLDLFVTRGERLNNRLYLNQGGGNFTRVTEGDIVKDGRVSTRSTWGDYDNDGDMDLYVINTDAGNGPNLLYQNDGSGQFTRVVSDPISTDQAETACGNWGDFDNDGDLDLFTINQLSHNSFLYLNDGHGNFEKVKEDQIVESRGSGSTVVDYDNDGDLDIMVTNGTPDRDMDNFLYRNESTVRNANNWINIRLKGRQSNTSAIGARIMAKAVIRGEEVWQTREIAQQTGHNSMRVHFGLGDASVIETLVIHWPSGVEQVETQVDVNQFLVINEDEGRPVGIADNDGTVPETAVLEQNHPNPFNPSTTIAYSLAKPALVTLTIIDLQGKRVRTLVNAQQSAGNWTVTWDGRNDGGVAVSSGMYLYRLETPGFVSTRKMVMLK